MIEPLAWVMAGAAALSLLLALWSLWRSSAALLGASEVELLPEEGPEQWLERLDEERGRLLERKRVVLRGLRDVRAELQAGRMDPEEAEALQARLQRRYAEVVAELDAQLAQELAEAERLERAALEAAGFGEGAGEPAAEEEGAEAPPSAADEGGAAEGAERPRCAECGTDNDPDACFCKKCGLRLPRGEEAEACEGASGPEAGREEPEAAPGEEASAPDEDGEEVAARAGEGADAGGAEAEPAAVASGEAGR